MTVRGPAFLTTIYGSDFSRDIFMSKVYFQIGGAVLNLDRFTEAI